MGSPSSNSLLSQAAEWEKKEAMGHARSGRCASAGGRTHARLSRSRRRVNHRPSHSAAAPPDPSRLILQGRRGNALFQVQADWGNSPERVCMNAFVIGRPLSVPRVIGGHVKTMTYRPCVTGARRKSMKMMQYCSKVDRQITLTI
jgi:hypothetical protein